MKNLKQAIVEEVQNSFKRVIENINSLNTVDALLSDWSIKRDLLTASSKSKKWGSVEDLKAYLLNRVSKLEQKRLKSELDEIDRICSTNKNVVELVFSIEWKKSATWGMNPNCELRVIYSEGGSDVFHSGSIGGCGYDKESTAMAACLNQVDALLKRMYEIKDLNMKDTNRNLFGYGSGYGILPHFEGGVGVGSICKVIESLGLSGGSVAHGKTFDTYKFAF